MEPKKFSENQFPISKDIVNAAEAHSQGCDSTNFYYIDKRTG
jgi:hypothetical protein